MAHVNRRIGKSSETAIDTADGTGGGVLDAFIHDYFNRSGNVVNVPGIIQSGMTASGGIINDYTSGSNVYRAHVFTSSGTFNVSEIGDFPANVEYLVVAGGGGGGGNGPPGDGGGGGGAGGLRTNLSGHPLAGSAFPVSTSPGSYTVTVGAGGMSEPPGMTPSGKTIQAGQRGNPSVFGPITSTGGGAGGAVYSSYGQSGGSGGGAGIKYSSDGSLQPASTGTGNTPPVSPSQGNPGGGSRHSPGVAMATGGGGGAGGAGGDAPSTNTAGAGGIGSQVLIAGSPASVQPVGTPGPNPGGGYFAGGGGGCKSNPGTGGSGGSGGGGAGVANAGDGTRGTASTGGGGGAGRNGTSGHGGSGIVVVRYLIGTVDTGGAKATGGNISFYGGKTIHVFNTSGTFTNTSGSPISATYVVVAGGGAGAGPGGGGGAGQYITGPVTVNPSPGAVTVQVGAGGAGPRATAGNGNDGTPSYFGTPITAGGGGGGGNYNTSGRNGLAGTTGTGSGGGIGRDAPARSGGTGTSPGANPGGGWAAGPGGGGSGGSGGGGAGGAGTDAQSGGTRTPGGIGVQLHPDLRNPAASYGDPGTYGGGTAPTPGGFWVAGGGGAGPHPPGNNGYGGIGGGGQGQEAANSNTITDLPANTNASENTGGGGGGQGGTGGDGPAGGSGGSGIVIVYYDT